MIRQEVVVAAVSSVLISTATFVRNRERGRLQFSFSLILIQFLKVVSNLAPESLLDLVRTRVHRGWSLLPASHLPHSNPKAAVGLRTLAFPVGQTASGENPIFSTFFI